MERHRAHTANVNSPQRSPAWRGLAVIGALSLLLGGCAAPPPPARSAPAPTLPAPPPPEPLYLHVALSADLDRCETDDPYFVFDSARLRPQDRVRLQSLAECLGSEPYRDLTLMLVGHADHRGEPDYNEDLARRRAQRVADALAAHGVERDRLRVVSRGEAEAIGHRDELASLGYDRRVDILVTNPVSPGGPAELSHQPEPRR